MPKNHSVTINGQTYTSISQAARSLDVVRNTLVSRLKSALPLCTQKVDTKITLCGQTFDNLSQCARFFGLKRATLKSRIDAGWPEERIIVNKKFAGKSVVVMGKRFSKVSEMLAHFNAPQERYNEYIKLGLNPEQAIEVIIDKRKRVA